MKIVCECKDGIQVEVIVRKHNEPNPKFTHEVDLPVADAKKIKAYINKVVND